jgi:hypothetical protein
MPSGKARLVEMMTLYPQRCIITNYPNERGQKPALDLGFDIEGFGHAYVSNLGMEWLSRQFGFISEDDVNTRLAEMAAENDQLKIRIKELEASVSRIPEAVEGILDGLKSLSVSAVNDLLGIVGDSSVSDAEDAEDGSGSDEPAAEATGRNNKTSRK